MTRTALITGAGRGIGHGIAKALAREGVNIAILDVLPEEDVRANLDAVEALGGAVLYVRGDVTRASDRAAVLDAIRARFGGLHILVNNAGVAPKVRADILEATEESFERLMRINLQGPYFLTQAVARWMIEQRQAGPDCHTCIVNISSVSATVPSTSRGEYCISKAGVSMATRLWAARLGEYDIPVYEIRPGIILTDMTAVVKDKYDKQIAEGLCRQKRWGYPEDIGRAVAALARGDLAYSTGQVINVDGGMTVQVL
ncbi:MAG: 3-oxoacyl-(acyl-carrier-protein) reductase FabG [Lentisphaerae bacterium ADurb.BinA184]|nr:MAG: 3-oxoacyl-(acyl-carrier-protein) reductase FabG [Lentisphaerae bacterium ADurb.BinA184]